MKKLFLLYLIINAIQLKAQQPVSYNYSTPEGLPSSEIYDILQDSKGFIWIATDRGVSKYDGYNFKNIHSDDSGLVNNTVFLLFEDSKERIWFATITGELSYYENDRVYRYSFNAILRKNTTRIPRSIFVDKLDNVTVGYLNSGIIRIDKNGNSKTINPIPEKGAFVAVAEQNQLFFGSAYNPERVDDLNDSTTFIFSDKTVISKKSLAVVPDWQNNITGIKRKNGSYIFHFSGYIAEVSKYGKTTFTPVKEPLIRLYEGTDSSLFIGTRNNGVRKYLPNQAYNSDKFEVWLNDETVTSILEDSEGGVWVGTLSNGIFYFPQKNIRSFSFNKQMTITALSASADKQGLFIGFNDGTIMKYDSLTPHLLFPADPYISTINVIADLKDELFFSSQLRNFFTDKFGKSLSFVTSNYARSMVTANDTIITIANHHIQYIDAKRKTLFRLDDINIRGEVLYYDKQNTLWVGDHTGLYLYHDTLIRAYPEIDYLNGRIAAITGDEQLLYVGTLGNGFVITDDKKTIQLSTQAGLPSNFINCIYTDGNNIWLGTNNGLSHILLGKQTCTVENYFTYHGLPGNEIIYLQKSAGLLWAATKKNLFCFDPAVIKPSIYDVPVFISSVDISGAPSSVDTVVKIIYNQFPVRIGYTGLCYRKRGHVNYKYRLRGLNENWHYTKTPYVDFLSLPPGEYDFEVKASNESGKWGNNSAGIHLIIVPPFWDTLWFSLLIYIFSGIIIIVIFLLRIQFIKRRNKSRTDLMNYRQVAMTMQMNPHFIFNSLNSIQAFILSEEKKPANKYLAKFSRLMRVMLENSKKDFITIKNETQALHLYLELEKLRFKTLFDYSIHVDPSVDCNTTLIPPMLIQPFVENSIKHAFNTDQEKTGVIKISIFPEDNVLLCSIEDNGKGYNMQSDSPDMPHESSGIDITRQRIKLLTETMKQHFSFKIINKNNSGEDNKSGGTLVIFTLPSKKPDD